MLASFKVARLFLFLNTTVFKNNGTQSAPGAKLLKEIATLFCFHSHFSKVDVMLLLYIERQPAETEWGNILPSPCQTLDMNKVINPCLRSLCFAWRLAPDSGEFVFRGLMLANVLLGSVVLRACWNLRRGFLVWAQIALAFTLNGVV